MRFARLQFGAVSRRWNLTSAFACLLVGFFLSAPASFAQVIDEEGLLRTLHENRLLPVSGVVEIAQEEDGLVFSLYRHPKANLQDLKIDTVLLAKVVQDSGLLPPSCKHLRILFFPREEQSRFTETRADFDQVSKYGCGRLTQSALLASVSAQDVAVPPLSERFANLSYRQIIANPVVSGAWESERSAMLARLDSLRAQGYDVSLAMRQFLKVEDFVRRKQYEEARPEVLLAEELILKSRVRLATEASKIESKRIE